MDKKKKPVRGRRFVAMWTWATMAGWIAAVSTALIPGINSLLAQMRTSIPAIFLLALITGLLPAVLVAWAQKRVIERYLRRDMSGWMRMSAAGGAIAGVLMFINLVAAFVLPTNPMLTFIPLLMPPAVMQWFWLRQRVKSAWKWPAAGLANVLLFTLPAQVEFLFSGTGTPFALLALILYPIISGLTMYHLWTQDDDKGKRTVDEAILDRLSDHDAEATDDMPDDDQDMQQGFRRWLRQMMSLLIPQKMRKEAAGV